MDKKTSNSKIHSVFYIVHILLLNTLYVPKQSLCSQVQGVTMLVVIVVSNTECANVSGHNVHRLCDTLYTYLCLYYMANMFSV